MVCNMGGVPPAELHPDALLQDRLGPLQGGLALLPVQLDVHGPHCGGSQRLHCHVLRILQKAVPAGPDSW